MDIRRIRSSRRRHRSKHRLGICCLLAISADVEAIGPDGLVLYGALTSDYVYRGISQSDEDFAVQLGVDYQHASGLFAGVWGSTVEFPFESTRANPRDVEMNIYLGYVRELGRRWQGAVSLLRRFYPDSSVNYDYFEVTGSVSYRDLLDFEVDYTDSWNGHDWSATDATLTAHFPLPFGLELEGTGGWFTAQEVVPDGYAYWNIGVSRAFDHVAIDFRYHDTDREAVDVFGRLAGERWVGSLSFAW